MAAEPDKNEISGDVILLGLGTKYFEMNCNILRTLLIDPTSKEEENYNAMISLFKEL